MLPSHAPSSFEEKTIAFQIWILLYEIEEGGVAEELKAIVLDKPMDIHAHEEVGGDWPGG